MKRDRVVIRSSSRPDGIGKEQSIDDKDKHSYNLWGIS